MRRCGWGAPPPQRAGRSVAARGVTRAHATHPQEEGSEEEDDEEGSSQEDESEDEEGAGGGSSGRPAKRRRTSKPFVAPPPRELPTRTTRGARVGDLVKEDGEGKGEGVCALPPPTPPRTQHAHTPTTPQATTSFGTKSSLQRRSRMSGMRPSRSQRTALIVTLTSR